VIWLLFTWAFLIFLPDKQFQKRFVVLILTFKISLLQLFLTFNLSFCNLATVLATFSKIGQFGLKRLVTLIVTELRPFQPMAVEG
jgi:hypothetical protein